VTETPPPVSHNGLAALCWSASQRSVNTRLAVEHGRAPLGPGRGTDDFLGLERATGRVSSPHREQPQRLEPEG
jgi:hypothetical protein